MWFVQSFSPARIAVADRSGRSGVKPDRDNHDRRKPPFRPPRRCPAASAVPPQPSHRRGQITLANVMRTRHNRNRHPLRQGSPGLPSVKLHQIVGAHDPDEPVLRIAPLQGRNSIDREPGPQFPLNIGCVNAGVPRLGGCRSEPVGQRCHPADFLQRILWADQPPDRIQSQPPHRLHTDMAVAIMRRIERPTKQTNVHKSRSQFCELCQMREITTISPCSS